MGLFTKDIKTMNDLFVHQLQDIYYAEQQLLCRAAAHQGAA
jgi:ferritin-like metal-binding protein YciE